MTDRVPPIVDSSPTVVGHPGRSVVLEAAVDLLFHAILATSLFFLFAGHNGPGGGFIGGLVAGTALVLRYLVSSGADVSRDLRVRPAVVLGTGLLAAVGASLVPWALGGQLLESGITYLEVPVLGEVPLASVLVFDTGVYLVVIGIILSVLSTLGAQPESTLGALSDHDAADRPRDEREVRAAAGEDATEGDPQHHEDARRRGTAP